MHNLQFPACLLAALALAASLVPSRPADAAVLSFSNTGAITIPSAGVASPYPSTIDVSGATGAIEKVSVTLFNMSHTFPDDLDIALVGPDGQSVMLMSDVGGSVDVANVTLTFDQAAAGFLPDSSQIASGTYRPTNIGANDILPTIGAVSGTSLDAFNGLAANGTWSLYVFDDLSGDVGSIANGWQLVLTLADPIAAPEPASLALLGPVLLAAGVAARRGA